VSRIAIFFRLVLSLTVASSTMVSVCRADETGARIARPASFESLDPALTELLQKHIAGIEADPENGDLHGELGLIYEVTIKEEGAAYIRMTLTTPMCPVAEELPAEVEFKVRAVEGVSSVQLDLVWDPPWSPDMMTEAAKLELGML